MTSSSPEKTPDLYRAWLDAVAALDLIAADGVPRHHGVGGRTLSGPAVSAEGTPVWLRVLSAPEQGGKIWDGTVLAAELVSERVPRPRLLAEKSWGEAPAFQALLWERIPGTAVSASPDLTAPVKNDACWWRGLRQALDSLSQAPAPVDRRSRGTSPRSPEPTWT